VPGTDFTGLHVFMATDQSATSMSPNTLITSTTGNMTGAMVADPVIPRIVLFSNDGTDQLTVTYVANSTAGLPAWHVVADMSLGAYDIFQNGAKIVSAVSTSTQGVLAFQATGGGTF